MRGSSRAKFYRILTRLRLPQKALRFRMSKMAENPNHCISRVDNPTSHGWIVRMTRDGNRVVRFFSDVKFGGKRHSQRAAKNFRDAQENTFTLNGIRARAHRLVSRQSRNKTGVIGLTRLVHRLPDGTERAYYCVSWHPKPGVAAGTTVSVQKYGEEKARRRAIAIRNKMMMRRYGTGVFRKLQVMREKGKGSTPKA
jgi:hypothetical protein